MMKALVYDKAQHFSVKEVPDPEYGEQQVLIKAASCGVCKTDVHIHNGHFISRFPLTPGHEFAGVVEKVGSAVTAFQPGERVCADNTVLCGECYYCRRDQPLYCENFYSLGVNGPGGFAEYVAVNQDKVFSISNKLSFDEASFTEPTACAVHGMDMIDLRFGDDVLMFGSGPTGIILAQLLKAGGAANLLVAAPTQFKLDLIEQMGIARTVRVDRSDYSKHEKKIKDMFPRGFDVIIDATGYAPMVEHCLKYVKHGSKIIVYGVCDEDKNIEVNPYEIFEKEIKIIGSFAQTHCFDRALAYLENGTVQVRDLITHNYPLVDYEKALDTVMTGTDNIKVIINPSSV
jgi:D-arabinitol dehydrogenase (NADP+)